jgi:hypothetical protein
MTARIVQIARRPRAIALIGLVGVALALSVDLLAAAVMHLGSERPAALAIWTTEHDFGTVTAGPVLDHVFEVRNTGDRRLVLQEVSASCSCGGASKAPLIIEAGATGLIRARLETAKIRGPMKIDVRYRSSDPERPSVTFSLLADVKEP